ncbi:hypothetical protein THAOC_25130, partial [Thalassiosira oceanica]
PKFVDAVALTVERFDSRAFQTDMKTTPIEKNSWYRSIFILGAKRTAQRYPPDSDVRVLGTNVWVRSALAYGYRAPLTAYCVLVRVLPRSAEAEPREEEDLCALSE